MRLISLKSDFIPPYPLPLFFSNDEDYNSFSSANAKHVNVHADVKGRRVNKKGRVRHLPVV
jgi:hypothetical protein